MDSDFKISNYYYHEDLSIRLLSYIQQEKNKNNTFKRIYGVFFCNGILVPEVMGQKTEGRIQTEFHNNCSNDPPMIDLALEATVCLLQNK